MLHLSLIHISDRLRRKRESNRKYMKKIREKSKKFAEHERIAEENNSDSKLCAEPVSYTHLPGMDAHEEQEDTAHEE